MRETLLAAGLPEVPCAYVPSSLRAPCLGLLLYNTAGAVRHCSIPPRALRGSESSKARRGAQTGSAKQELALEAGRAASDFSGTKMRSPVALIRLPGC